MFKKIDHLGIAVDNLETACKLYEKQLGITCVGIDEVPEQKVRVAFFPLGESSIELLEPTSEDSPIAKFLAKKGPGIHHVALSVDNIEIAIKEMQTAGLEMIDIVPRSGAHGARIAFVHPKSTPGLLMELCERK